MITEAPHSWVVASAAAGLVMAGSALWLLRRAWLQRRNPVDLALTVAVVVWIMHLVISSVVFEVGSPRQFAYVTHLGSQALLLSVAIFLLTSAGLSGIRVWWALGAWMMVGLAALHWRSQVGAAQGPLVGYQPAWISVNLLATLLLAVALARRAYLTRSYPSTLALAGCMVGLGIYLDDVLFSASLQRTVLLSHHFYAAFLLLIWYLVTRREARVSTMRFPATDCPGFTDFDSIDGLGVDPQAAASAVAVAGERRRIAQDLHDGVGSQIVSILSSLDSRTPEQYALAIALERCLADLKMTVDAIESADGHVVEALGSLRYRVQPALNKLRIRMTWKVDLCAELEVVHGMQAQQVLRIAQECLSNVMRHANASAVKVVCRFVPESNSLLLEVYDNGKGMDRTEVARKGGKGLESMRRRAQTLGGVLQVKSQSGAGTCVRLTLPLSLSPAPRGMARPNGFVLEPQGRQTH